MALITVTHIAEYEGPKKGRFWILTLACGHKVARPIPPIRRDSIVVRRAWKRQRAPERVRCHYCENPLKPT